RVHLLLSHLFSTLLHSYTSLSLFFFHDPAPTEIYTLSLHDALPIYSGSVRLGSNLELTISPPPRVRAWLSVQLGSRLSRCWSRRSEEHTSELQSLTNLVCRLLLEKKKQHNYVVNTAPQPHADADASR